jgi:hypothetical protein
MKTTVTKILLLAMSAGFTCVSVRAGTYLNNFNTDPAADPNFSIRPSAKWVPAGSFDGSGYISLTDDLGGQQGTIVLPDFDAGLPVASFTLKAKVRIGGGTGQPADGMSISFCDASDGIVGGGALGEEGTASGLSVNLDTWDNGNGDGPAMDIKLNGVIVAHKRFSGIGSPGPYCAPVEKDGAGNPLSLETDAAGTPDPGTFVDLEITLSPCGAVSVKYKGIQIFQDVVTGYSPRAGRFVFGARTGGAWDNHWIDDLMITTSIEDAPPFVRSPIPALYPARDVSENQNIHFTIDGSLSFYATDLSSIRLVVDGVDVTSSAVITPGAAETAVDYAPATPWAPASAHVGVLTYMDDDVLYPGTRTARVVFYVTPVVASTAAGTTLFIEAEDFNYFDDFDAGLFFDFGSPNGSYSGLKAKHDVDYHLAASNPDSPLYRVLSPPNGISVPGTPDDLRAGVAITPDYKVGWNDPGDWYNYTRTFPNTTYKIYGRFASGGAATHVNLSKVTSNPAVGGQTTVSLGTFDGDATGGWDTFCFIPLRNASGQDVIVRLNGLTTVRVTTLPGNDDFNYLAFVPTPAPTLRPTLVSVTPAPGSESLRDPLIKAVIADADTQVVPTSIRLFLDGTELTPVVQTDTPGGAEGEYQVTTPLAVGSSHTAQVIFADNDAVPVSQTNTWTFTVGTFKSGNKTLFIEAEDFNYSDDGTTGGLHANFGDPDCSLLGKDAIFDVDYHEVNDGNDQAIYRAPTGVEAGKPGTDGFVRGDHVISCNYIVGWNDTGDWYNYTRDFGPSRRYNVYARLSSGGGPENAELAVITSNPAQPGQSKSPVGNFSSPATGNWDIFHTVPLRDSAGNLSSVRLSGLTTLRFTTGPGNLDFNYLAFVEADVQVLTPTVASTEPRPNSDYARAPKITAVITDQDSAVDPSSLKLIFDGRDVTALSTSTDTPSGAMIMFQAPAGSPVGTTHTVQVQWKDNQPTPVSDSFTWSYREGIYNPDRNLFIESEDFNTDNGNYIPSSAGHPFNEKGLYNTLGATPDVDYHDSGDGQESNLYRTEGINNVPHVNMVSPGAPPLYDAYRNGAGARPGFEVVPDYKIGWTDPGPGGAGGDWYNYTRDYGAGSVYAIFLRASHGDPPATIGGRLELVDDPSSPVQTTTPLGNFRAPSTAGWDTFTFIPLRTADGSLAAVPLSGVATLRYTVEANGGDINYLMLCPLVPANRCPTASPQEVVVDHDSSANFQLQASDPDGDPLLYTVTQAPSHGTVVVQAATGAATYAPTPGYCGPDSFKFMVTDGACDSAEATVSITVNCPPNTPPSCVARVVPDACGMSIPGQQNVFVISLDGSEACVILDGSGSMDADNDPLQFTWSEGTNVLGTSAVITNCLSPGCHLIVLTVSDGKATCSAILNVCVVAPCEAVEQCIALVNQTTVTRRNKRPIIASLKAACASFDRGNFNSGMGQLEATQHKISAQIGRTNPTEAQVFNDCIQRILDAVPCAAEMHSQMHGNNGVGNGEDPPPPGNPPVNDGPGTSPGDPGLR